MKKLLKAKVKEVKAITLIALVVTIVILLIISTVAITLLVNNNLMGNTKYAVDQYNNSVDKENNELAKLMNETDINTTSRETNQVANPTGTIISFAAENPPDGYLACNGQEVSRTTYSKLFEVIGTKYGEGDGSTTFKVPDLRGEFLRGAGNNSHTNSSTGLAEGSGGVVGEHQEATKHVGVIGDVKYTSLYLAKGNEENADSTQSNTESVRGAAASTGTTNLHYYTARPTNTSVLYCIKY